MLSTLRPGLGSCWCSGHRHRRAGHRGHLPPIGSFRRWWVKASRCLAKERRVRSVLGRPWLSRLPLGSGYGFRALQ